jgi:hypothetical protein
MTSIVINREAALTRKVRLSRRPGARYEVNRSVEHTISKAFLTAHLLTGSIEQAESAVTDALASWDKDKDSLADLFQAVLDAAVRRQDSGPPSSKGPDAAGSLLPSELQTVLALSLELRRCFVLRMLAGLSVAMCARLLQLHPRRVKQYTCAALKCLPSGERSPFAISHLV